MKTAAHTYTDVDIGEYVLGLPPPETAAEIQSWLAQNNAAAACALKWEAYLLCITDSLPQIAPPPELHTRIQASLGHLTAADEAPITFEGRALEVQAPRPNRRRRIPRLRRGRIAAVSAGIVVAVLLILIVMATLRPTPQHTAEHPVHLTPVNPVSSAR